MIGKVINLHLFSQVFLGLVLGLKLSSYVIGANLIFFHEINLYLFFGVFIFSFCAYEFNWWLREVHK